MITMPYMRANAVTLIEIQVWREVKEYAAQHATVYRREARDEARRRVVRERSNQSLLMI